MTHSDRVRAHHAWPHYLQALQMLESAATEHTRDSAVLIVQSIAERLATDLQLTQAQRYDLPHLAKRRTTMGRPRKTRPRHRVCCPHCSREFEVEVD